MSWQAIDFLGMSIEDDVLIEKLDKFLYERREYLVLALLQLFPPLADWKDAMRKEFCSSKVPQRPFSSFLKVFRDNREALYTHYKGKPKQFDELLNGLNGLLWEHAELLEGSEKELFLQLGNMGIDHWNEKLKLVVEAFEKVLLHHVGDVSTFIEQFTSDLKDLETGAHLGRGSYYFGLLGIGRSPIDKGLTKNLASSENFLKTECNRFVLRLEGIQSVTAEIDQKASKLMQYEALNSMGPEAYSQYSLLYRLLKLWKAISTKKNWPKEAFVNAFYALPTEKMLTLLTSYYKLLENLLFDKSRTLKTTPAQLFTDVQARSFLLEGILGYRREVQTLGSLILRYRDYLLRTDPDPYIRSRWGFRDNTVGPEPSYSSRLTELVFSVERLDELFGCLSRSFEEGPQNNTDEALRRANEELRPLLHALGQPFVPASLFRSKAETSLNLLEQLNELGSFGREVVDYVRQMLSRLLRADWKEHQLHEMVLFQAAYSLHQGIIGPSIDKVHEKRLVRFKELQEQVFEHMRKGAPTHSFSEIEYDINDIKGYLQDFLATIQRSLQDDEMGVRRAKRHIEEAAQQLLEYRYSFGLFFNKMLSMPGGKYIRSRFMFVEHYFETIENKIYEFKIQKGITEEE